MDRHAIPMPETVAAVARARLPPAKHTREALEEAVSRTVNEGVEEVVAILLPDNESEQPTPARGERAGGTLAGSENGGDEPMAVSSRREVRAASEVQDLMQVNNDRATRWTRLFAAVAAKRKVRAVFPSLL